MTAPFCRLYLVLEPSEGVSRDAVDAVLDAGDIACVLLRRDDDRPWPREACQAIAATAQARDVAVLAEDDVGLAADLDLDGAHVAGDVAAYRAARDALGAGRIVGFAADARHEAMQAGEAGADYVAFGLDDVELLAWWVKSFVVPCVALAGDDLKAARPAVAAGVEFLAVSPALAGAGASDDGARLVAAAQRLIEEVGPTE